LQSNPPLSPFKICIGNSCLRLEIQGDGRKRKS